MKGRQIKQKNSFQYEAIKAQCSELESDMTLEEATAKQTELKKKISDLKAKLKDTQKKLNLHNKRIQDHATKKNKLKEECLNLQKKVQCQNKCL